MHVDFARVLINYKGEPILDAGLPVTFGHVVCTALVTVLKEDHEASVDDKLTREDLAARVWRGDVEDITVDEAVIIKRRVSATYPSAELVGSAVRILEGKADRTSAAGQVRGKVVPLRDAATDET